MGAPMAREGCEGCSEKVRDAVVGIVVVFGAALLFSWLAGAWG